MPTATVVKEQEQEVASTQKPVKVIRLRAVSASIFANKAKSEGRDVAFHKVSVQRSYKSDDGEWKQTTSLGRDDLPLAITAMQRAWEFILDAEANRGKDEEGMD